MMSSLPQELLEALEGSSAADLVTVDSRGQPMAWRVEPSFDARAECIDVGAVPSAGDAERDAHVALLFSDDDGAEAPMVLVQGTATVHDGATRVRPERVYVWPRADLDAEPRLYDAHVEEVRSGHNEEPEVGHAPPTGEAPTWDPRLDAFGPTYASAVLAFVGPDGFPFAVRVGVRADHGARVVYIDADPVGAPIEAGLACLCAGPLHVSGDLEEARGRWVLRPHRVLAGTQQATSVH